jgi:hypothetical protein
MPHCPSRPHFAPATAASRQPSAFHRSLGAPSQAADHTASIPTALEHFMFKASATILLAASCFLLPLAAHALQDAAFLDATALLQKAQASGEEAAVKAAAERWKALAATEPASPLVRAYAGSAISLQATTTLLPWRKLAFAEDGLAMIDKALALMGPEHDTEKVVGTPVAMLTRFAAANTFLALPSMFNRGPRGEQQLEAVLKHPGFATAPLPFKGAVWLRAGAFAAKEGRKDQARQWFDQVVASNAPQAAAAQNQLKAL